MAKESMNEDIKQDKAIVKKAFKMHDAQEHKGSHTDLSKLKKGGKINKIGAGKAMPAAKDMGVLGMKKGGKAEVMGPKTMSQDVEKGSNKKTKFGEAAVQKRGHTRGKNLGDAGKKLGLQGGAKSGKGTYGAAPIKMCGGGMKKMAMGGRTSARADGIASRGKTKTKYC
jgi:hypothetical protein